MKRKSTFLRMLALLALMVPWTLQAQNAKVSEYDGAAATAAYSSIAGTSGATAWTQGDYVDVSMPFAMYFGETQIASGSTLRVYPDGSASFTSLADSRIAPLYLAAGYTTTATSIYTKSSAQQLVVEWRKVVSGQNSYSFQLKLYPNGDVEFCYGPMTISSSINVLVGMMSSSTDIYRVGGANGTSSWDDITRYTTGTTTRTLSSTYKPTYDAVAGTGMVYTFTQPACVKPNTFTATATSSSAISLAWTVNNAGVKYEVKYSTNADFDPATEGTTQMVNDGTALSANITGLSANTTYYFALRKYCDASTPSGWIYAEATTDCAPYTAADLPIFEDFDSYSTGSSATIHRCWTKTYGYNGSHTNYPYPSSSYYHSGNRSLYFYSTTTASYRSWVAIPYSGPMNNICVNLWAYKTSAAYGKLQVGVMSDPDDFSTFELVQDISFTSGSTYTWYNLEAYFDGYTGTGNYIVILAPSGAANYVYVDDITISTMPACRRITDLAVSDALLLTWNGHGGNAYEVKYATADFDPATEGTAIPVTTASYQLQNLEASTVYYVYVRSTCSDSWEKVVFTTPCTAITISMMSPYTEDFNSYTTSATSSTAPTGYPTTHSMPLCWSFLNMSASTSTYPQMFLTAYSAYSVSGKCLFFKSSSSTPAYAILPQFTNNIQTLQINYTYRNEGTTTSNGTLYLGYMTDPADETTFVPLQTCNQITTKTTMEYSFATAGITGSNYYIAFRYTGGSSNNYYLSIDDVEVSIIPNCAKPANIAASNITDQAATLSWTETSATPATQWQVKIGESGFDPATSGRSVIVNGTPSTTVAGLTMTTEYDVYVRAICGDGDTSAWSNVYTFSTICMNGGPVTIGNGTTTNSYFPFYSYYKYSLTQQIYTAAEMGGANTFYGLSFQQAGTVTSTRTVDIYMCETTKSSFESATDWIPSSQMTLVYSGPYPTTGQGWQTITFTTPFDYSGVGNVVVCVDDNTGSYVSGRTHYTHTAGSNTCIRIYSDGTNYDVSNPSSYSGTRATTRNNIRFESPCLVSCNAPQALNANVTGTSVELTWSTLNTETPANAVVVYGAPDFDPYVASAGTRIALAGSALSTTLSNLPENSSYDAYVYYVCSSTDSSAMTKVSFSTTCTNPCHDTLILVDSYGDGWNDNHLDMYVNGVLASSYSDETGSYAGPDTTITVVDMCPGTIVTFQYVADGIYAGENSMTIVNHDGEVIVDTYNGASGTATLWSGRACFTPNCHVPNNLAATSVTYTTATLDWNETTTPAPTQWVLAYQSENDADPTYVAINTKPYTLTGLTANTNYAFAVRAVCEAGVDSSDWSNTAYFYTGYCVPNPSSVDNSGMTNLVFGDNLVVNTDTTYGLTYGNFTNLVGDAGQGTNAEVQITYATGYTYGTHIWVDWNNDLDFDDDGELVYTGLSESTNPTTLTASFTVPATAALGDYRMRIGGSDDDNGPDPCYTGMYACLFDFTLRVAPAPTCYKPTALAATNVYGKQVTLNWNENTPTAATQWQLCYTANGETTYKYVNTNNNYILTGLAPETDYTGVMVRAICGAGDTSNWSAPISFTTIEACSAPTGLTGSALANKVTLSWNENTMPTAATRWEVAYGTTGFDPDDETQATYIETTNRTNFEIEGLHHSRSYQFYVRALCGDDGYSDWSNLLTLVTPCGAWSYADMPLVEDFDGVTGTTTTTTNILPNSCWSRINTGTTYTGMPQVYNSSTYAASGTNSFKFYVETTTAYASQYAVLPEMGFDLDTIAIELSARFGNATSEITIGVMSDPDSVETFVPVTTIHAPSTGYSTHTTYTADLQEYTGTARYIAIAALKGTTTNYFYIDDLQVKLREKVNTLSNNGGTLAICNEVVIPDTVNANYGNNINATYVINPAEAGKVVHLTGTYDLENGYDFLRVYEGVGSSRTLVGTYTGKGSIDFMTESIDWANHGSVSLVFTTDADNSFAYTGFKLLAQCECPQPVADTVFPVVEENGTYTWINGVTYTNNSTTADAADDVREVFYAQPNIAGCDSVYYKMSLTLHPTYNLTSSSIICERDSVVFYGQTFKTTGTYTVTLASQYGADSVGVLNLQVNPAPTAGIYYGGNEVTEITDYCDNADLTLLARSNTTGVTFAWEDQSTDATRVVNPHESNTYTVIATNPTTGCTSLPASLTVTTTPVPALTISGDSAICYGQSATLTLADANNVPATYRWSTGATTTSITVNPTETTTYTVTATTSNASACTATASLEVVVNALPVVTATASVGEICRDSIVTLTATAVEGYSYSWNTGATTAVATTAAASTGAYTVTVTDQNGCQNEFSTSTVTVYPSYELNDELSVCYTNNPYTWGSQTITANGNYDQNFTIGHGCDSLVHLTFTFEEMGVENSNREVCEGTSVTWGDQTITATESTILTYVDNTGDCPVQRNLYLTVNYPAATAIAQTVCDSYTWNVSGETYTTSGAYPYTLATTKGCDSVVTLNLTVNYSNTGDTTAVACDNFEWRLNGVNYTASTEEPTFTLQNQWGCDSTVTLHLTVNYRSYHEDFHCVRDARTFTWDNGRTYSLNVDVADGIEWISGENAVGCNEIAQLHLVMNPVVDTLNWITIDTCDEYEVTNAVVFNDADDCEGHTEPLYLTESGDYQIRTRAADGHDQWTRIHLTVNYSSHHTTVKTECLPYEWKVNVGTEEEPNWYPVATITEEMVNGASVYNMSYEMPQQFSNGCSHIEVLRLTPKYPTVVVDTVVTICDNQSWTAPNNNVFSGAIYTSGIYTWDDTELNTDGCPMTKQVDLTVNPTYSATADLTFCESEFALNEVSGEYELTINDANHDGASVVLTIPGELNQVAYTDQVVASWHTALGCDSTVTINYTVNPTLYAPETYTVCYSDRYEWDANGNVYDEPGTYTDKFETVDSATGCTLVRQLNLTVLGTYIYEETVNVCTSYEGPDGETYRDTRTFDVPFEGTFDSTQYCDAITRRTYNVQQGVLHHQYVVTNLPYTWQNGKTYTQNTENVYYDVPVGEGCDSVLSLHLTMVDPITLCDNAFPYETGINGIVLNSDDYTVNTVSYCLDNPYATSIGTSGGPMYWAIKYEAGQIGDVFNVNAAQHFYDNNYSGTYTASVYAGGDNAPGTLITSKSVTYSSSDASGWKQIHFDDVATIDNQSFWLVFNTNGPTYPATSVQYEEVNDQNSTWVSTDGSSWDYVTEYGLYYAWMLKADISTTMWRNNDPQGNDTILYYTVNPTYNTTATVDTCDSYTWEGQTYTESGNYTMNYTSAKGCDSVLNLNLTIRNATASTVNVTVCDSYTWAAAEGGNDSTYTVSGTYSNTIANNAGCDSVITLNLTINKNDGVEVTVNNGCDSYTWTDGDGQTYTASGDYSFQFTDANGCVADSVLHLTINPSSEVNSTLVVNEAASYTYLGVMYTAPFDSIITHTYTNQYGCDSIDHLRLIIPVVADDHIVEVAEEACGSYTWEAPDGTGHTYVWIPMSERQSHGMAMYKDVTANQYVYTYPTDTTFDANGVMTTVRVLHLNLLEATYSTDTLNLPVSLGSYTIDGDPDDVTVTFNFDSIGTPLFRTVGVGSVAYCNDYRTYTINIIDNYDTTEVYACADETTYEWNSQTYTIGTPGHTFWFSQTENAGTLNELVHVLKVNQRAVNATTATETACDSYTWTDGDSLTYTTSGTYVYNYTDENQCAASKTLTLTVNYNSNTQYTDAACDTYTWSRNNQTYTTSGVYYYNYTNDAGCASTDSIILTINNNSNETFTEAVCNSYTWEAAEGGNGQTYTTSGTYTYNYNAANGCPSVNTLNLTINLPTNAAETVVSCDSTEWNGTMYYTSGDYTYDYNSTAGCASTDTLHLTINNATHNTETTVQCDSYEWNGQTYTASGDYQYSYTNAAGCASVDTLHLTINVNTSTINDTIVQCDEYTWAVNNRLYNASGNYTARTTDANGCATTNTLTLTINHSSSYDSVLYVSDGSYRYTYQDQHQELFGEGVYNVSEHYTNVAGCDSTLNITFKVGTALLGIDNVVNCNTYTWRNGETYVYIDAAERNANLNADNVAPLYKTSNGVYVYYNPTYTVVQENNYDSIYMLALTLTQSYQGYDEVTLNISDRQVAYGDSIFHFDTLAVLQHEFVNTTMEFDVHFPAVQYCDSIITLTINLVNNYQEVTDSAADICVSQDSYTWRGHTISTDPNGEYDNAHTYYVYDTLATGTIEYITVNQHPFAYATERRTACDSYEWNGTVYTDSTSNATAYFPAGTVLADGTTLVCDSTVTLILIIHHNTSTTYDVPACESYVWLAANGGNGDTLTESGTYTYDYLTAQGCPSTNTLNLTINHNTSTEYTVDECDSYTWTAEEGGNGTVYTTTGEYTYDYVTAEGCPSTNTLNLTIRNNSNQTFTKVECDSYTWEAADGGDGQTYTATGVYTYDYEAENGCPSTNTLNLTINVNSSTEYTVDNACDSYTWHETEYTASGDYTYDYQDVNGCASEDVLHLTVNYATHNSENVVACHTYTWHGNVYTNPSTVGDMFYQDYTYNYTNEQNCPSVDTLHLTLGGGRTFSTETVTNCGPYTWIVNNEEVATLSSSIETSTSFFNPRTGCDSVVFLYLTIYEAPVTDYAVTICDNELPYTWTDGETTRVLTEAGEATVTYPFSANCDSTVRLTLTVNPTAETNLTDQICLGNGYNANGFNIAASELATAGVYNFVDHRTTDAGCEHTYNLTLTVGDVINNTLAEVVVCDSYTWNAGDGETYTFTESGTYNSGAYANAAGCTTIDVLPLTINVNAGTEYTETVCDAYMWNGTQYTESGDYTYDYTDGNGCASTDVLHLTVNASAVNNITVAACDSYTWTNGNGETYTTSGVYTYNYTTSDGCNGTDYLVLTINQNSSTEYTTTACDTYVWDVNGMTYTESGDYTFDYTDANGCASTDVLHLTVNQNSSTEYTETACDSYTWNGTTYTTSGDYSYEYINLKGCASTDVLHLTVNYNTNTGETETACDSYTWDGTTYTQSGTYYRHYNTADGCASVDTLFLTINNAVATTLTETACDSYTWNGQTYTTSGEYTYTATAANGCDSVVTLALTVNSNTNSAETVTACGSYTWNGTAYANSGDYTYSYTTDNGCASVDTLHLTISETVSSNVTASACSSYNWNGNTYTQSGNYTYTTTAANGCDSIVTLALTINTQVNSIATAAACNSYTWNGTTYTTSGNYTHTYTAANGCDSTVTLMLTINQPKTSTLSATACESYTWNNTAYTTSGNYTHTYTAANGCDSVVTLTLTINQPAATTISATACDSYTWNGATYTTTGSYTQNYTTVNGCDSVVTLALTITPAIQTSVYQTSCNSYTWNGTTYTTSGNYTHTFTSASGCDSVVTLYLTVTPAINMTTAITACDSYTWNGTAYTTTGSYTHTYTAVGGCDSVVTLLLTVNNSTSSADAQVACDSYTWIDGQTYTASTTTPTYTTTNAVGCDSVVTLNLTIKSSTTGTDVHNGCDSYIWIDNVNYTESTNTPTVTYTAANGCDSVITLHLTVNHSVEVYDTINILQTDLPYNYNDNSITAAGDYVYNGTTVNGCDSTVYLHVNVEIVGIDVVNSLDDVTIYPNPTRGRVTVTADEVVKVEVLDIVGRLVATFENTNTFDISNLGEGAYTLRITLPNGTTIRKVVKK